MEDERLEREQVALEAKIKQIDQELTLLSELLKQAHLLVEAITQLGIEQHEPGKLKDNRLKNLIQNPTPLF